MGAAAGSRLVPAHNKRHAVQLTPGDYAVQLVQMIGMGMMMKLAEKSRHRFHQR